MEEEINEPDGPIKKRKLNSIWLLLLYNVLVMLIPITLIIARKGSGSMELYYSSVYAVMAIVFFDLLIQCFFSVFVRIANITGRSMIGYMLYLIIPLVLFNIVSYHGSFAIADLVTGKDISTVNVGFHGAVVLVFIAFKVWLIK